MLYAQDWTIAAMKTFQSGSGTQVLYHLRQLSRQYS